MTNRIGTDSETENQASWSPSATEGTTRAFAQVVLPIALDQAFTYSVPASLRHRVAMGMRVVVPFQKRVETGAVVGLSDSSSVEGIRAIIDLPDDGPIFSAELLDLCKWMSEYYCCAWGEALASAVPAGIAIRSKKRYALNLAELGPGRYTERQRKVIAELHGRGPLSEKQLAKTVGATALSNTLRTLEARGIIRAESVAIDAGVSIATETWVRLNELAIPSPEELERMQRRAPRQAAVLLDLVNNEPERMASSLYERHGVDSSVLRLLEQRGAIERYEREFYRAPNLSSDGRSNLKHDLNGDQRAAFDAITAAMDVSQFQPFLLQGITGSGKTEVYLQAIEHALKLERTAIILVPEISLTPQTVGRFKSRFDADIAVLHSGLGAGERYDEWRRAQRGEVRIVVGARSAIFAPLPRLGVIVVDEEHDNSYKQSETPRYHARDVAIMRAKLNNAVCVLGSATPSIESYHNSESGKSVRIELHRRATNALLPEVELVDMRTENREAGMEIMVSRKLETEIGERLRTGDQVLLLLNRRGFAPFVLCPKCGWCAQCPDCNVTLTYHAKGAFLSCHYCNGRRGVPLVCDECHFNPLLYLGMGTQKVEDYLQQAFPDARIERMDADTTSGKGGHAKILGRLASGEIDVLVGTQMIAKGHDYPGVTLVGVINADSGLRMPDFRAAETTFQLLTQVAGRAGRGDKPGHVIIQTFRPNHYAVVAAAKHDYAAFFAREIAERNNAQYPPFRRMANLMIECEDPERAERCAAILHRVAREQIAALNFDGLETLGPSPATIRRIKKLYRWNLGMLSKSAKRLNTLSRAIRDAYAKDERTGRTKLKIDLDPYGMY
ncbi:MAG: primosomal protein N' [Candidatus Hydrogenedentes bacterium]|nr:primosomal protein N' [Candidatus Hydrogenedentota bacterium]